MPDIPPVRMGQLPEFSKLGEYPFQDICRDVLAEQADIDPTTCRVYGTRGQKQRGIDIIAQKNNRNETVVGQCKCYAKIDAVGLTEAIDDFIEYLAYWQSQNVTIYMLFVACVMTDTKAVEQESIERDRLKKEGIALEVWDGTILRDKLGPHERIVRRYLQSEDWVVLICGERASTHGQVAASSPALVNATVTSALLSQSEELARLLGDASKRELESALESYRCGRTDKAKDWIKQHRETTQLWNVLNSDIQASIIRLQANILAEEDDMEGAKALTEEAHHIVPLYDDSRLRARIAWIENGPEAALALLQNIKGLEARNLKCHLLLELGDLAAAQQTLLDAAVGEQLNAETCMLRALFLRMCGDLEQAYFEIQKAADISPKWENIRFVRALIEIEFALAPDTLSRRVSPAPEPIEWHFVRRDLASLALLRGAHAALTPLASNPFLTIAKKQWYDAWRLASVACDPDGQDAARETCVQILEYDPSNPFVVMWVIARRYDIDIAPAITRLVKNCESDSAEIVEVMTVTAYFISQGQYDVALELLARKKSALQSEGAEIVWAIWYPQALSAAGRLDEAIELIESSPFSDQLREVKTIALHALPPNDEKVERMTTHLHKCYEETGKPKFLYELCSYYAITKRWKSVIPYATELVERIETVEAVAIAANAYANTDEYRKCLDLLNAKETLFHGGVLSRDLRLMRQECLSRLGLVYDALSEAKRLVEDDDNSENSFNLAKSYEDVGDIVGLASTARSLLTRDDVAADRILWLASRVLLQDQSLGQLLWKKAADTVPHSDDDIAGLVILAHQLGLERESERFLGKMQKLAAQNRGGVEAYSLERLVDSTLEYRKAASECEDDYRHGRISLHVLASFLNIPLSHFIHVLPSHFADKPDPIEQFMCLIQDGAHTSDWDPAAVKDTTLRADITALLVAEHVGVLETIERCLKPIRIAHPTLLALEKMLDQHSRQQPGRIELLRQVDALLKEGKINVADGSQQLELDPAVVELMGNDWAFLYRLAQDSDANVVDYFPLSWRGKPVSISDAPEKLTTHVIM